MTCNPLPLCRMTHDEILNWLRESNEARLADLWRIADQARQAHVGGEVHLRGLIEISNHCIRLCGYCGLRAPNRKVTRYRMTREEVAACVRQAVALGYGTVVLQSGEDPDLSRDWVADLVRRIKSETPLAVTLSLGERDKAEFAAWREAGADRYLLRFETSNERLYARIHPARPGGPANRLELIEHLAVLGYEVGSGVMIGIPGQTYDDLARDIALFAELDLDMIGCGPYLVHPDTPLGSPDNWPVLPGDEQVPANERMAYKVIALARLVCPRANIPSTTALATLNRETGRELGLVRGANVVMPNLTPPAYRQLYEIYPGKACIHETAEACQDCLQGRIESLGRKIGSGRGDSPNYRQR